MTDNPTPEANAGDAQTSDSATDSSVQDSKTTTSAKTDSGRRRFLLAAAGVPVGLGAVIGAVDATFLSNGTVLSPEQVAVREQQVGAGLSPQELTIDPTVANALDVQAGDQVRITTDKKGVTALYTIADLVHEAERDVVRASPRGRTRLSRAARSDHPLQTCPDPGIVELPSSIDATIDDTVVDNALSVDEAKRQGELVEKFEHGNGPLAIAPHGGNIQPRTAFQASVLSRFCDWSSYRVYGFSESSAFVQWYVPSQQYSVHSFPTLETIADHTYDHVISFSGICPPRIVVGGTAPRSIREHVRDTINQVLPTCATTAEVGTQTYDVTDERTLVNRLSTNGGLWIGQGPQEREKYAAPISLAVAYALSTVSSAPDPDRELFEALGDSNSLC